MFDSLESPVLPSIPTVQAAARMWTGAPAIPGTLPHWKVSLTKVGPAFYSLLWPQRLEHDLSHSQTELPLTRHQELFLQGVKYVHEAAQYPASDSEVSHRPRPSTPAPRSASPRFVGVGKRSKSPPNSFSLTVFPTGWVAKALKDSKVCEACPAPHPIPSEGHKGQASATCFLLVVAELAPSPVSASTCPPPLTCCPRPLT